jgi:menaquinone-specific isochorismate synthase
VIAETAGAALYEAVRTSRDRAAREDRPVLVSITEAHEPPEPIDLFEHDGADRFFWKPAAGPGLVGDGVAWSTAANDLCRIEGAWRDLLSGAVIRGEGVRGTGPLLFGTFAFDPSNPSGPMWRNFPLNRFVLPRVLYTQLGNRSWRTISTVVLATDDPERITGALQHPLSSDTGNSDFATALHPLDTEGDGAFRTLAAEAVAAIRRGMLTKLVAARAVTLAGRPDIATALRRLGEEQSHGVTFAVGAQEQCFLGSTPEWLVRLEQGTVRVSSLAGSAPRGATEAEDERLGRALLSDPKNLHEHALVLDTIRESLADLPDLQAPDSPGLLKLPTVQHLYSPVSARADGQTVLSLGARLHPTPAVAGLPRDAALAFLRQREGLDRGGYAGPVGWVDRHGEGELAVAIRSALVRPQDVTLFAGCGVVSGSQPENELQESRLKLLPMLRALGAGHDL